MTPDILVIKAARGVLAAAFQTNEKFRNRCVKIVTDHLPEHPNKDELAVEILKGLFK